MSHSNRTFVVAYVFLVALPITGLAGILRSGRNLKAPTSIDGAWSIQATKGTFPSCMGALGLDSDARVAISQSGENFSMSAGKAVGSGIIEGSILRASLKPAGSAPAANCGGDGSVMLAATIDANASPRALSGTFSVPGCSSCDSVEIHAVKQATQKKGAQ